MTANTSEAPTCCGQHPPGAAGEPLVLACQLCPHSPTYWRTSKPETTAKEPT